MSMLSLALAYLRSNLPNTLLHIILMTLGMTMMTSLLLFGYQAKERLYRDSAGIDVVVGAKGSPLQLILSSVQHVDIPTGNISLAEAEHIKRHPHVKKVVPISLGDSYHRFRIVGSEPPYLEHFKAEFSEGKIWNKSMQAVIGHSVARETGLTVGKQFAGAHGLIPSGHNHDERPYEVVGVLKPTSTVLDRLIVTSLDSVWDVHEEASEHEEHHDEHKKTAPTEKEVTALLITYNNRAAMLSFPRQINQQTSMQAASPAFELARLVDLVGMGTETVMIFGIFLIGVSLAGVFIGLLNSIRNRRYDIAIFRTLGASRKKILLLVIIEGMTITIIGSIIGLAIGHGAMEGLGIFTEKGIEMGLKGLFFLSEVWIVWGLVLLLSLIACILPAWEAYKTDIRTTLTNV